MRWLGFSFFAAALPSACAPVASASNQSEEVKLKPGRIRTNADGTIELEDTGDGYCQLRIFAR